MNSCEVRDVGEVYVLSLGHRLFKIGKTANSSKRIRQLRQASQPSAHFWVRYCVNSMSEVEADLHRIFSHKRIYGEVFTLNPRDQYFAATFLAARSLGDQEWTVLTHEDWKLIS